MEKEIKQSKKIIEKSNNILILSHTGPDLDAFCSMLITKIVLEERYPKKKFSIQTKQGPSINIPKMQELKVVDTLNSNGYDSIIITDAGDIGLCIDKEKDKIDTNLPTIIIDHHTTVIPNDKVTLINHHVSSATEELYWTFKDMFGRKFKINKDIAELLQIGIVTDTGRFLYDLAKPNTFRVFADAKEVSSVDLEEFTYKNSKFPREATPVIQEYLKTLTIDKDMAYMYIDRETVEKSEELKKGLGEAQSFLRDRYIRFIQGVHWGFIIKPDLNKKNNWFISFRSTKGYQDVKVIAEELGGGGHIYSAGVPFQAKTLKEVLNATLSAVKKHTK